MTEIRFDDIDALNAAATDEFGDFGAPVHISQEMVNTFADLTDDHQWLHLDVDRCRAESPFGATVAHGFLTLSMMPPMMRTVPGPVIVGHRAGVNYGAESLRFLAPVRAGSDVAAKARLIGAEGRSSGTLVTSEAAIHVVGAEKPSVLYRFLVLYQG